MRLSRTFHSEGKTRMTALDRNLMSIPIKARYAHVSEVEELGRKPPRAEVAEVGGTNCAWFSRFRTLHDATPKPILV